jgi:putative ABC transport system substrate-binding protein
MMSRRQFVVGTAGLGLLAGCGRLPGQASPTRRPYRIGWLQVAALPAHDPNLDVFRQGLLDLGYVEGQDYVIERRSADGDLSRLSAHAAELAQLPVDTILAAVTAAEQAHEVTSTIPIVMVYATDPVAHGLVASLARPGGNVTGLTYFAGQLQAKRLELLKETVAGLSRVAVLQEADYAPAMRDFVEIERAAGLLSLHLVRLDVRTLSEVETAFEAATREGAGAILLGGGGLWGPTLGGLVALAAQHRLPTMYYLATWVRNGGLMAYAADPTPSFRRAAYYVDRILKGTKPADLPVEQPMTFDFVVNLKTAQALGITFPNEIMLQVTEVIQ